MSGKSKQPASQIHGKRKWVKPFVSQMKAGSAKVGTGTVDDGDPSTALNNS